MNKGNPVLLKQFIKENASLHGDNSEAILKILIAVQKASTKVHTTINKAGLEDILGAVGGENIQGEQVQKLDLWYCYHYPLFLLLHQKNNILRILKAF